ncbi:patatin-like phospholipase family protein [Variovorax saccharolyticus]|uniref:patatin-like phospholipase family protein n=1 Tax=Variovorax saccharolyticus TaxID=3053516 RepID=UPI002578F462|nr:patatin-like phospholipase family protein [Variovorax sp. J22R187]MDM0022860.1 patatin-like phospholipase family protein [Variovorax sp. J22R187]
MSPSSPSGRTVLNLALQGGGAHGAFTWGVLDALLDRPDIEIGRVSGTSAGALNGAALVTGLVNGGRQAAKDNLERLWRKVAEVGAPMTFLMLPLRKPGLGIWDDALPLLSPYQTNPVALAPLRHVLGTVVDLEALRTRSDHPLFVNAVNVHSGLSRVFGPQDMSMDAILASACAPLMFQAVQIDGESYWDGSYAGNPMLWPLYREALDTDIFMVELTPLHRAETPTTAKNILNRINEVASINGLLAELRALDTLNRTVAEADIRLHVLSLPDAGSALEVEPSIKRAVGPALFESLRRTGRAACEIWLEEHHGQLGRRATVNIERRYLAPYAQPGVAA